jgi:hypothetical protein
MGNVQGVYEELWDVVIWHKKELSTGKHALVHFLENAVLSIWRWWQLLKSEPYPRLPGYTDGPQTAVITSTDPPSTRSAGQRLDHCLVAQVATNS